LRGSRIRARPSWPFVWAEWVRAYDLLDDENELLWTDSERKHRARKYVGRKYVAENQKNS
jgi:hypothetical protein